VYALYLSVYKNSFFNIAQIGLMRCGKLLAESAPQKLLERFQCSYLEEAFLKLCEVQNNTLNNEVERFKAENTSSDVFSENEYERTKVCI